MDEENRYSAGQRAPQTGIYQVIHYQHRLPHKVVMQQGQRFPACNTCGKRVTFRLSSTAEPLISDRDFIVKAA